MSDTTEEWLTKTVLRCRVCLSDPRTNGVVSDRYQPVYSFGSPAAKKILVVGLNPSSAEWEKYFLARNGSWRKRKEEQFTYFDRERYHPFFRRLERLFTKEARSLIGCSENLWGTVAYLDLVKCVTEGLHLDEGFQWGDLEDFQKEAVIGNCEGYLLSQIRLYGPRIIIGYGKDAGEWLWRNKRHFGNARIEWIRQDRFLKKAQRRREQRKLTDFLRVNS